MAEKFDAIILGMGPGDPPGKLRGIERLRDG